MITNLGVIIAAGGSSSRFGTENKLFATLNNIPVIVHSTRAFLTTIPAEKLVVTAPQKLINVYKDLFKTHNLPSSIIITAGGATRMESVHNGLLTLPSECDYVAIHDAARPLVTNELISACYDAACLHKAAIPGRPVTDTLKRIDEHSYIEGTVDRNLLVGVETPQTFHLQTLLNGYKKACKEGIDATDDAAVMEHAGHRPYVVINKQANIKITYPDDLIIAEALLNAKQ